MTTESVQVFEEEELIDEMFEESLTKEGIARDASYGFLGSASKQVVLEAPNGHGFTDKNDDLTVPAGTRRVKLLITRADIGFGNLQRLIERPLGRLYYRVNVKNFSGRLVTFEVRALCRDINGDDPWWARITVSAMCFG